MKCRLVWEMTGDLQKNNLLRWQRWMEARKREEAENI